MSEAPYLPRNTGRVWKMAPLPDSMVARDGTVFNPNAPAPQRDPVPDMRPQAPGGLCEQAQKMMEEREAMRKALAQRDNQPPPCLPLPRSAALDARMHDEMPAQCEALLVVQHDPPALPGEIRIRCYLEDGHDGMHHGWYTDGEHAW